MKYILITILFATIFIFSGCTSLGSGNSIGGVFKSVDNGRTFEPKNIIDEKHSLNNVDVTAMAIDLYNSDIVYAGTKNDDVYVSIDETETWSRINTGLKSIKNIIVNPFNTQIIYVSGLYEKRGSIIKSIDGGENWERVYVEPKDGTNITAMIISPINGESVYMGTSGGTIARTLSGGESWENLYHATDSIHDLLIDAGDLSTLYALVGNSDIVKSRDDGITFESVRDMERDLLVDRRYEGQIYSMDVSPSMSGVVVVGTDKGVFRSDDYGKSWNAIDVIASTIGIPIHAIKINPHDVSQLVYAAAKAVYTSIGEGWAITDTTSNRVVDVIMHDPFNKNIIYLGVRRLNNN